MLTTWHTILRETCFEIQEVFLLVACFWLGCILLSMLCCQCYYGHVVWIISLCNWRGFCLWYLCGMGGRAESMVEAQMPAGEGGQTHLNPSPKSASMPWPLPQIFAIAWFYMYIWSTSSESKCTCTDRTKPDKETQKCGFLGKSIISIN